MNSNNNSGLNKSIRKKS